MSDKKISQLAELTSVDEVNDFIPIVDSSLSETKKVSPSNLPTYRSRRQTSLDLKADDSRLKLRTLATQATLTASQRCRWG